MIIKTETRDVHSLEREFKVTASSKFINAKGEVQKLNKGDVMKLQYSVMEGKLYYNVNASILMQQVSHENLVTAIDDGKLNIQEVADVNIMDSWDLCSTDYFTHSIEIKDNNKYDYAVMYESDHKRWDLTKGTLYELDANGMHYDDSGELVYVWNIPHRIYRRLKK